MVAMMTGRFPADCGLVGASWVTEFPQEWSLASKLRAVGFRTGAVVSNPTLSGSRLNLEKGFETFDDRMTGEERNRKMGTRNATETTDAALEALGRLSAGGGPWFFWVHYLQPHGPYSAPASYMRLPDDPGTPIQIAESDIAPRGLLPRYQFLPECRGRNDYAARYRSSAAWTLDEADRFLRTAMAKGYLKDTTIVFTADHGELMGEDDYWFEHGVRINPASVHVPLIIARSVGDSLSRDTRPVSHLDIVPTVLKLLGMPAEPGVPGIDLFGGSVRRSVPIVLENIELPDDAEVGVVLDGRLAVKSTDDPPESFRIQEGEWPPVTGAMPEQTLQALDGEMKRVRRIPMPTRKVPPEEVQKLKALGYAH